MQPPPRIYPVTLYIRSAILAIYKFVCMCVCLTCSSQSRAAVDSDAARRGGGGVISYSASGVERRRGRYGGCFVDGRAGWLAAWRGQAVRSLDTPHARPPWSSVRASR